ncbi:MAG: hypothetical protein COV35_03635 [Alphaproteobacteria bacterium CG11_big_fil_rev_8_21_14_0_20_39_49]|nr:MAG: hypothetical protein COV35_03635 [Alphaproteobacteria bacterium CG11_big_fil_rev_8_21_14_0_20_39_49]
MATVVFETAGRLGGQFAGAKASGGNPLVAQKSGDIGATIGRFVGNAVDEKIFGIDNTKYINKTGPRLENLSVQSSAYGQMIPIIYGTARVAGNIIWSQPIQENVITSTSTTGGGKGGGSGKVSTTSTTFTYSVTLAIAICEGEIDELIRVWADSKAINPNDGVYRLYKGTQTQDPDSLIESIEGVGSTPAYRGLAYIVMENIPLADFGNRIPNFTFEVRKSALNTVSGETPVEDLIKSICVIPGAGEFVYDDTVQSKIPGELIGSQWIQQGNRSRINQNNRDGKSDALVSLDQLEGICPNLEWVAVVVTWFGDNLDAGTCVIQPGVEYQTGAITEPDSWGVGGYTRSTARQITLISGTPRYGGTPSDASLLRYIREIKNRGYNVMFYPMFFMDVENKPWRGRVTGSAADVAGFFTKTNGYNAFINHYATLVKDDVDAFVIGSEMIGLTSVQDVDDSFPAVDELVSLAASVKATVGGGVKVTYAADWSEYHHEENGWYNLDPLWASSDIDFVGIDAYFPLTDEPEPLAGFTQDELQEGWTSGEGYDWYYSDAQRTTQTALSQEYAWKNIAWWWNNTHTNPDMSATAWTPQMKKIWFTEFGFPSVDGASNQPNVFIDPDSSESAYPYYSKGKIDFRSQRNAIKATLEEWNGSSMIEKLFLWTWDSRPYPYWPDLTGIWADGGLWRTGHWVTGKLGLSSLGAIVSDLCRRTGLSESQIDVTRLNNLVRGFILNGQTTARIAIDSLRAAYFFDAVESDGLIKFVSRGGLTTETIGESNLISGVNNGETLSIERIQELELPKKIDVNYINEHANHQIGNQHSERQVTDSVGVEAINLPIIMSDQDARVIADVSLYNSWVGRTLYSFVLPIRYASLEPTDIINIQINNQNHVMRIINTQFGDPGMMKASAVAEDISAYDFYSRPGDIGGGLDIVNDTGDTALSLLDLPAFPTDDEDAGTIRYAVTGLESGWKGAVLYRSDDDGANYHLVASFPAAAVIGVTTTSLPDGVTDYFDEKSTVTVSITGNGELSGTSELAVLNGANIAKVGSEIIQFKNATLVSTGKYILSGLLRGRLGTEWATSSHTEGEEFVLLDNNLAKESLSSEFIGLSRLYKAVSVGKSLADTSSVSFTYNANSLKPFSPVHIKGTRDASGNLTITWIRRTRVNGGWRDNVDVPLGQLQEAYEVDIMNGGNVVRTISGLTSATVSYSAAEQTTDFGSAQSSINVRIYQMSHILGRGTSGEGIV